jgi:hypothetical protein
MNGKVQEELAIKYSNFNDELPTNTRKVQETATNIDYYVFFPSPRHGLLLHDFAITLRHTTLGRTPLVA